MPLVVHPHFHPRRTGVTRHVESVVPALARRVDTRTFGFGIQADLPRLSLWELWRRARSGGVIWHAHRNNELLFGLCLRLLAPGLRVAFTRHSTSRPSRYTRFLVRHADLLVALTQEVQTAMELPAQVIPHGIDPEAFRPPADRAEAWRALGLRGARGVGVIGRIREEKGQGDFVEALTPLLSQHPEWTPVLVGTVKPADSAFGKALRSKSPGVVFAGEQSNVSRWYQGLTLCVHPSRREAFSMALLEALASGCCVIASRLPAMAQVIDHGRNGFLYTPGNVQELRSLLAELMADPERAESVGRVAAEDARRRWSIDAEVSALRDAYQSAWSD